MFNKNKNINVGRDINIQINKKNFENLSTNELAESKNKSKLILNRESSSKLKKSVNWLIFGVLVFFLLYLGLPYLLSNYGNGENTIITFFSKLILDKKISLIISSLGSFMAILNPISDLWKTNEIEKKHYEILKTINIILKEREYLNNK
ncbi:hypothetical protein AB9K32_05120 [Allomuricauda sp. XS_ASV26]|uniref:hypothetical protein n=1 Tax=Allomuricauda sp. XS_ASV26 TaxID=3241292 RepID=UPI00351911A2